jgi:hypothetical protein
MDEVPNALIAMMMPLAIAAPTLSKASEGPKKMLYYLYYNDRY